MWKTLGLKPKTGVHLCNVAIVFFLVAFLSAFLFSFVGPFMPRLFTGLRFPLAGLMGIAVDDLGNIYTVSQLYGRVQVFDRNGKFIKGWFCPFSKGSHWININKDGNLSITHSHGEEYIYTIDGKVLAKKDKSRKDLNWNISRGKDETYDPEGNLYAPIDSFRSKVIKFSPSGEMSTVVSDPIWLCIIKVPFCLIFLLALVFVREYFQKFYMKSKKDSIPQKSVPNKNSISK